MDGWTDRLTEGKAPHNPALPPVISYIPHETVYFIPLSFFFLFQLYSQPRVCYPWSPVGYVLSSPFMGTSSPLGGSVPLLHAQGRTDLWASTFYPVTFITTFITLRHIYIFTIFQLDLWFSTFLILWPLIEFLVLWWRPSTKLFCC